MSEYDYIHLKTQNLLDFGVEQVIWVFTTSKKVLIAEPGQDWLIKDWGKKIDVLGLEFSVEKLLKEEDLI